MYYIILKNHQAMAFATEQHMVAALKTMPQSLTVLDVAETFRPKNQYGAPRAYCGVSSDPRGNYPWVTEQEIHGD